MDIRGERKVKRFETLLTNRQNWEDQWQDALKHCMPQNAFVTRERATQGERVDPNLYDSTAKRANQVLAAGFHGNLTNPATRWFRLRIQDEGLNNINAVRRWLADAEQRIMDVLNSSNFTQEIHQCYLDLGSVGTSVLLEVEDAKDVVRFQSMFIKEIVIDEDHSGRVDTVY